MNSDLCCLVHCSQEELLAVEEENAELERRIAELERLEAERAVRNFCCLALIRLTSKLFSQETAGQQYQQDEAMEEDKEN